MPQQPIPNIEPTHVEIRAFSFLKKIFDERDWPFPLQFALESKCSGAELAEMLSLPVEKIEAVFVNGCAKPLAEALIKPGDRIAFVPYGTPGPYRVLLGFFRATE